MVLFGFIVVCVRFITLFVNCFLCEFVVWCLDVCDCFGMAVMRLLFGFALFVIDLNVVGLY